jgi:hypothetical protein
LIMMRPMLLWDGRHIAHFNVTVVARDFAVLPKTNCTARIRLGKALKIKVENWPTNRRRSFPRTSAKLSLHERPAFPPTLIPTTSGNGSLYCHPN